MTKTIEERAIEAMNQTWQAIGADALAAVGETEGSIGAETTREVVASAGRLESYGYDDEAVAWFRSLGWEQRQVVLKQAFPN